MKVKKVLSLLLVSASLIPSSVVAFGNETIGNSLIVEAKDTDSSIPIVKYDDVNNYDTFIFDENQTRGTSSPTKKHSWSDGAYDIDGSSNKSTLYTNKYFTDIVGRTLTIEAGYENDITIDLVHKGSVWNDVTYTWTISAGESDTIDIVSKHTGDFDADDKYFFRFNSNPLGTNYSITGTFE